MAPTALSAFPAAMWIRNPAGQPGHHLEWFENVLWFGMTSHVGGIHLANLKMAQRMAERVGDHAFARQCRAWFEQGSASIEDKIWAGAYYLAYNDPRAGKKSDDVFAYQLDGEWMARFHGLHEVFRPARLKTALATIRRACAEKWPAGAVNLRASGWPARGGCRLWPERLFRARDLYARDDLHVLRRAGFRAGDGAPLRA